MTQLEAGAQAPAFSIEAAVSGRTIATDNLTARRTVLIFHGPKTQDAPKTVGKAVRAQFPDAADVMVANIVNLKAMAGMWQKVANAQIKQTYDKLAAKLTDVDPADYVVICPDWENLVAPRFGIEDANREAVVVVLDDDSNIVGTCRSGDLAAATIDLLA